MQYTLVGLESERLKFRLLCEDDFNSWLPFFDHPNARRFLGLQNLKTQQAMCHKWFEITFDRYRNNKGGMHVLIDKKSGEFIGQCGLLVQIVDELSELEIGYSILPHFWNLGYATEAARASIKEAFSRNYADSLISIIHMENIQSEKVARKNNMVPDKKTTFKDMPVNIFRIYNT